MTQEYELTIHVLEVPTFNVTFEYESSSEEEKKTLEVKIEPYENEVWTFKIIFSDFVYVPANYTDWSNENEGSDRIQLEFRPNQDTQFYLENTDTQIDVISWLVLPPPATQRRLQANVVEVKEIGVEISLT